MLAACGDDVQDAREAALFSLGYDADLRVGELTAVTVEDLHPHPMAPAYYIYSLQN